ncbi:MAG: signal peptidase I [Candidatus Nomurabacteria bacterium]|nr:signal peptidase I [Candidatus Nomurabacteria bacterium]
MENINTKIGNEKSPVKSKFKEGLENFWELVKFAIVALIIVIPIRMFVAQPFLVSGDSMFPTFHNGEYLIVDELSYIIGSPHRGDVIVFRYPGDTKRFFIKRIIGLPNEEVSIKDGIVTIINKENPKGFTLVEPYIDEKFNTTDNYKTGDGEYFVMGDNRNRSSDSRVWAEPNTTKLTNKLIIGRAYLRLLPLQNISYLPGYFKENK